MKRIMSIICVVAMLFSFATSAGASDFDFMGANYKSYDADMEFYFESGSDLGFLTALNEEIDNQIDLKYLINDLLKAKFKANVKAQVSEDNLSGKMYVGITANTPINFSENLKISVDSVLEAWVEYDVTSVENFKMNIVLVNPLNGKYITVEMDNSEALSQIDGYDEAVAAIVESFNKIDNTADMEQIYSLVKSCYEGNAKVEKSGDYTVISFTNDSLVELYFDCFEGMLSSDYIKELYGLEDMAGTVSNEELAFAKAIVKSAGIFADADAFTMKVKLDAKGQLAECEEKLHVQFNIVEIAEMMGASEEDLYPVTKENSDIDLAFVCKSVYSKVNEEVEINIPVTTEENSVNVLQELLDEYAYTESYDDYDYQPEHFSDYCVAGYIDGDLYVSIDDFAETAQYDYDNCMSETVIDENGRVQIVIATDYMAPVVVDGYLDAESYTINGVKVNGKAFTMIKVSDYYSGEYKDIVGVSPEVFNKVLQAEVQFFNVDYMGYFGDKFEVPECYVILRRPNRGYTEDTDN